jgi:GTPase SAR1 family protein
MLVRRSDFPFLLIGNKVDLQDSRKVAQARAANWAKHKGIKTYFECSASDDINVSKAFEEIAARALARSTGQARPLYAPVSLEPKPTAASNCSC